MLVAETPEVPALAELRPVIGHLPEYPLVDFVAGAKVLRIETVLNNRLYGRRYIAGDEYTIADMIGYPWTVGWQAQGQDIGEFRYFKRWFDEVSARPPFGAASPSPPVRGRTSTADEAALQPARSARAASPPPERRMAVRPATRMRRSLVDDTLSDIRRTGSRCNYLHQADDRESGTPVHGPTIFLPTPA